MHSGNPLVSVVMPVWNREKYLAEAIESILTQSFSDFELIAVDDGSEDDSVEVIKAYEERDPRVRSVFMERQKGMSAARNRGFAIARGDYIAYMDSDDVSLPTRLEKQVAFLGANPDIGAVGVAVQRANEDLSQHMDARICPPRHGLIVFAIFTGMELHLLSGTMMIRRSFIEAIGGWNEKDIHDPQEGFYVSLLLKASIRFANLTEILYLQRVHDDNKSMLDISQENRNTMGMTRHQLRRLWGGIGDETLRLFRAFRWNEPLSWADRRAAKKDLKRVMKTLLERGLVDAEDKPLLLADINRRLERSSPRRWQQFCHWRRKWFGGLD